MARRVGGPRSAAQKAAQLKASKASAMKRRLQKTTTGRAVSTGRQRKEAELKKTQKMIAGGVKGDIQIRMQMDSSGKLYKISKKGAENMLPLNTLKSHRPGTVTSLSGRSRYKAKSKKK